MHLIDGFSRISFGTRERIQRCQRFVGGANLRTT